MESSSDLAKGRFNTHSTWRSYRGAAVPLMVEILAYITRVFGLSSLDPRQSVYAQDNIM